jgi:hypothetical protein
LYIFFVRNLIYPLPFLAMPATPNRGRHFFLFKNPGFVLIFSTGQPYIPPLTHFCAADSAGYHIARNWQKKEDGLKAQILRDLLATA